MKFKVPVMYKVFLSFFLSLFEVRKIAVYRSLKPFLVLRFKDLKNELQKWCDGHLILNNP